MESAKPDMLVGRRLGWPERVLGELGSFLRATAPDMSESENVDRIIHNYAFLCAVVACQPIPIADAPVLTAIETVMASRIAAVKGLSEDSISLAKNVFKSAGIAIAGGWVAKHVILTGYKIFLPGPANWFVTFPTVFSAAFALGCLFDAVFQAQKDGRSWKPDRKFLDDAKARGRSAGKGLYEKVKRSMSADNLKRIAGDAKQAYRAWKEGPKAPQVRDDAYIACVIAALAAGDEPAISGPLSGRVIDAMTMANPAFAGLSHPEIGERLRPMSEERLGGVLNNTKGKLHEILVMDAENADGDAVGASMHEELNHPGSDLVFTDAVTGEAWDVSVKATDSASYVREALERYPHIPIVTTEETAGMYGGMPVEGSGFSDSELEEATGETVESLTSGVGDAAYLRGVPLGSLLATAVAVYPLVLARREGRIDRPTFAREMRSLALRRGGRLAGLLLLMATPAAPFAGMYFIASAATCLGRWVVPERGHLRE